MKFKYLLNWFNSSIDIIFNHLEILQSGFNISFIKWKEDWSFDSDYSFNINSFIYVMKISHSSWIKSSIGFHQAFEWKIHLFQRSIAETDSSIFLAVFGLEFFYSTWCGLSIQMIHPKLKLKEKTQWWINKHFIEIDTSFARRLSSQQEEKKISIKIDDLDLVLWLNSSSWKEWIRWNNEIH